MKQALSDIGVVLTDFLKGIDTGSLLKMVIVLPIALLVLHLITRGRVRRGLPAHQHQAIRRLINVVITVLALLWIMTAMGMNISVLLGAAGVLTVALGFAAQTSTSNLISGLFLMFERPFKLGDLIEIGETTGYVLSIDVLSIKLRTFDNRLVRLPNETVLKTELTNLTHLPLRRVDLKLGVAYKEALALVEKILLDIAKKNPLALDEPQPFMLMHGFGDSSVKFQFSVWATQANYWQLLTQLYTEVKARFDEEGIEIPFPHVSLYAGKETSPIPVEIVEKPNR